jgi:hypothetical protein
LFCWSHGRVNQKADHNEEDRDEARESATAISSTIPSAKYSCSGSPLMFSNGNTRDRGLVRERERGR